MEDPSGIVLGQQAARANQEAGQMAQLRQQQLLSMIMNNKIQQNTMNLYKSPAFQSAFSGDSDQSTQPTTQPTTQLGATLVDPSGLFGPPPAAGASSPANPAPTQGSPIPPPQALSGLANNVGQPPPQQTSGQGPAQTPLIQQESQSEAYVNQLQNNATHFQKAAMLAFQGGAPGAAMQFMNLSNKMGTAAITAKLNFSKMQLNKLKSVQTQADLVGQTLGSATTPQEWQQGLQTLSQSGQFSQQELQRLAQVPFSPQNAAYLQHAGMTASQNARLQIDKLKLGNTTAYQHAVLANRDSLTKMETIRTQMEAMRLAAAQKANAAKNKAGVTDKAPNAALLKNAQAAVTQSFGAKNDPGSTITEAVASRAQDMMRQNPGLSQPAAIQRATAEMRSSGALKDQGGNVTMSNNGATQYNPVLVPMKGGKPDYIKLQEMAKAQGGKLWVLTKNGPVQWMPQ